MTTWYADAPEPVPPKPCGLAWLRVVWRGAAMGALVFGGLLVLLAVRLVEAPLCAPRRPATPHITQWVCRGALRILGLRLRMTGLPIHAGAAVANHSSWLDILVLNACARVTFVSKAEVASWPGIGWLARATGTLFVRRERRAAQGQTNALAQRLLAGELLLLFPEGTSTDGRRVLPFKTTLFQALLADNLKREAAIQPVSVYYQAPDAQKPGFYGWWGDMDLGPHLLAMLAQRRHGCVHVIWHPLLYPADFQGRKDMALEAEGLVRAGFDHLKAESSLMLNSD